MYYNHQLRTNLQEWKNRFLKSGIDNASNNLRFLFQRIHEEPIIKAIILDITDRHFEIQSELELMLDNGLDNYEFDTEEESIATFYFTCKWLVEKKGNILYNLPFNTGMKERLELFKDIVIEPLFNFLHERIDSISYILYILEKYKLRTEWFTKKDLLTKYKSADKSYEDLLEEDLRLFLFDQGIDYPFSTPKSASGRADVVSLIDTSDPLVLEIKIYDSSKGYRKERIQSGFAQIVKYTHDYHKDTGYLVVFNIDNVEIEIAGKETDNKWPNRFIFNGKTYYVIFINMNTDVTASKQGVLKREIMQFDELTKNI